MEGYNGSGTWRRPLPPLAANIRYDHDLTPSNSGASSLTADCCKGVFRRSANVKPDDSSIWTDEKHNLFLHHLEVSFVEELYWLKSSLAQCSKKHREINIWEKGMICVNNDSEQNGCWRKVNCVSSEPLFGSASASPYVRDLIILMREGMGQNFSDEDNQSTSNFESQAKRMKRTLEDGSHKHQNVLSRKCAAADYAVISCSTCADNLSQKI